jgi:hypothetical protein
MLIFQYVKPSRIRLTADRGFPDDDLFALLDELKVNYIIRVKGSVKVLYRGAWAKLNTLRFEGNARRRSLGRIEYCQSSPRRLWATMSRFALFVIALMAVTALGMQLLVGGSPQAKELLRRVASRRRDRCELSLIAAVIALVQQDKTLFAALSAQIKFKLDYVL